MQKLLSCFSLSTLLLMPIAGIAYPFAYLPQTSSNQVQVVDVTDNQIKSTLTLTQPIATEVLPNGRGVAVASQSEAKLTVFPTRYDVLAANDYDDASLQKQSITLASAAVALAVSPDSQYVWASLADGTQIARVKLSDASVTTFTVGFAPGALVMSNDGTVLYAAGKNGGQLAKITSLTAATPTLSATWTLSQPSVSLALNSDGSRLYASQPAGDQIAIVNTSNGNQLTPLELAGVQALTTSGAYLYAAASNVVKAWAISGDTLTPKTDIAVSGTAVRLSSSFDGQTLYLQNELGAWRKVASGQTNEVYFPVFGRFAGPYPSLIRFSATGYQELEGVGTTKTVKVIRTGETTQPGVNDAFHVKAIELDNDDNTDAREGADETGGADFRGLDQDFTFGFGQSEVLIPITIYNDSLYGIDEYFQIELSKPTGSSAMLDPARASIVTFTIEDDDDDPRENRSGCSVGSHGGAIDPALPLLSLGAAFVLWRRSRART